MKGNCFLSFVIMVQLRDNSYDSEKYFEGYLFTIVDNKIEKYSLMYFFIALFPFLFPDR